MALNPLGVALALALGGSAALNASYVLQRAGTREAPAIDARRPLRTARALVGSPAWVAGLAVGLAGWGLYVGALTDAPLSLVQGFAAGGLLLAVPAAAVFLGERPPRRDCVGVAAMVVALVLLGVGAAGGHAARVPSPAMAALLAVAAAGALVASVLRGPARGRALAAAAGALYGAADAATKAVAIAAHGGLREALIGPWSASVVAASAGAFLCFQRALQLGPAVPVIALMTFGTNATAIAAGLLVFGDPLGRTPVLAVLHAGGLAAAALSSFALGAAQGRVESATRAVPPASPLPARRPRAFARPPLGAVAAWTALPLAIVAGLGWLYLVRGVGALALGPDVPGALPLEQLAHHDAQPLARLVVAWIPAGASAGAALAAGTRRSRPARAAAVGLVGCVLLVIGGAVSDAAAISSSVPSHLPAQLARPGTWAAAVLLVIGALAVRAPGRPIGVHAVTSPAGPARVSDAGRARGGERGRRPSASNAGRRARAR